MEIRQLQFFLTVAQTGSFSEAAEDLFISQSSLSKQIISLETELGVSLFDRSRRKIALTPAGESLLGSAHIIDDAYQAMLANPVQVPCLHRSKYSC